VCVFSSKYYILHLLRVLRTESHNSYENTFLSSCQDIDIPIAHQSSKSHRTANSPYCAFTHFFVPLLIQVYAIQRLLAANLPEYKKVDDTRRQATPGEPEVDSGDNDNDDDSLPDVHWCKAFLCYYSCWSRGRLRMPPRWRLERVDLPCRDDEDTTGGNRV
jgi:hypothetical protein